MKNIFIILLSTFLIAACSSAPKEEELSIDAPVMPVVASKPVLKVEKKVEIDDGKQTELEKAIASENDEKIKVVASELLLNNPRDANAINALSVYYLKKKQYKAATLMLNKLLVVNPRSSAAFNNLGLVELGQGSTNKASVNFRKAIQLNPDNYQASANLAAMYAKVKDYDKVIFALEKAVQTNKADIGSLNNYAIASVATGKYQQAANIYEKILKAQPEHKNVMLNYSILMIEKQDKFKDGLDLINRLKFVGVDNEARLVIKELENKAKAGLK